MANKYDQDDDSNERSQNSDSDDTFGLPEINYEPIRRNPAPEEGSPTPEQEEIPSGETSYNEPQAADSETSSHEINEEAQPKEETTYTSSYRSTYEEEESSVWPKVLGVLGVVIVLLALVWYFVIYKPKQDEIAEKERIEAQQKAAAQKAREEEEARLRMQREAAEKRRLDSLANLKARPGAGAIEKLNDKTGRYYVIIASALDEDLLMDYAKKLSTEGITCKIIPPFGKYKVSRISIAEGDTFAAAAARAEELKGTYGDAVWVLKY